MLTYFKEENMTEATNPYRAYLEELAESRGLPGAQELAQAAAIADPDFTTEEILKNPPGGFGQAIDAVFHLSEEEKVRLTDAWRETFIPMPGERS